MSIAQKQVSPISGKSRSLHSRAWMCWRLLSGLEPVCAAQQVRRWFREGGLFLPPGFKPAVHSGMARLGMPGGRSQCAPGGSGSLRQGGVAQPFFS